MAQNWALGTNHRRYRWDDPWVRSVILAVPHWGANRIDIGESTTQSATSRGRIKRPQKESIVLDFRSHGKAWAGPPPGEGVWGRASRAHVGTWGCGRPAPWRGGVCGSPHKMPQSSAAQWGDQSPWDGVWEAPVRSWRSGPARVSHKKALEAEAPFGLAHASCTNRARKRPSSVSSSLVPAGAATGGAPGPWPLGTPCSPALSPGTAVVVRLLQAARRQWGWARGFLSHESRHLV